MFGKDPQMMSLALMGFGNTLSALSTGQQPNNGAIAATMAQGRQRADRAKAMQESGIMDLFTPEQRAALMIMEPGPATQIIANKMFPAPQQRQIFKGADGYNYYLDTLERVLPGVELPQQPGPEPSAAEAEIRRIMEAYGVPYQTAVGINSNILTVQNDPETGQPFLVDKINGTSQPLSPPANTNPATVGPQPGTSPTGDVPPGEPVTPLVQNAESAFGLRGIVNRVGNSVADAIGMPPPNPEALKAHTVMRVLEENMLGDIAIAYDRPPKFMMERFDTLTIKPGTWQGPETAKSQIRAFMGDIDNEIETLQSQLRNPMKPALLQQTTAKIVALQAAQGRLKSALASFGDTSTLSQMSDAELDAYIAEQEALMQGSNQ